MIFKNGVRKLRLFTKTWINVELVWCKTQNVILDRGSMKHLNKLALFALLTITALAFSACATTQTATPIPVPTFTSISTISSADEQIYSYMESIWDKYDQIAGTGSDRSEALVFIDASEHFNKSLLEISRAYNKVAALKAGNTPLTDAEQDVLSMDRFQNIGFLNNNGQWSFEGVNVNMGTSLPLPDSMKPQQPETGHAINVTMSILTVENFNGVVKIVVATNLPDGTDLMGNLQLSGSNIAQDSVSVNNGKAEWVFPNVAVGSHNFEIIMPVVEGQPDSVKARLSERGRNLTGDLVKV